MYDDEILLHQAAFLYFTGQGGSYELLVFCLWFPSQSWHCPEELPSASLLLLIFPLQSLSFL